MSVDDFFSPAERRRQIALTHAVKVTGKLGLGRGTYSQVVDVAKQFETYLKGAEK